MEARLLLTWPLQKRREYLKHPKVQGRADALKAELLRLRELR